MALASVGSQRGSALVVRSASAVCAVVLVASVVGCRPSLTGPGAQGGASGGAVDAGIEASRPLTLDEIRDLGMTMAEKRESLPADFPAPVPVMAGEVTEAGSRAGVVFYTVHVDAPMGSAQEWYRRTYEIANWRVVESRSVDGPDGLTAVLAFEKGSGARSDVSIRPDGERGAIVEGTVSLGVPASGV